MEKYCLAPLHYVSNRIIRSRQAQMQSSRRRLCAAVSADWFSFVLRIEWHSLVVVDKVAAGSDESFPGRRQTSNCYRPSHHQAEAALVQREHQPLRCVSRPDGGDATVTGYLGWMSSQETPM